MEDASTALLLGRSVTKVRFSSSGEEFSHSHLLCVTVWTVFAAYSAIIGAGGGFLCALFMISVLGLPGFIVAGTSTAAVIGHGHQHAYLRPCGRADWALLGLGMVAVPFGPHPGALVA